MGAGLEPDSVTLGQALRKAREGIGLSQIQAGIQLGLNTSAVSEIEHGKRRVTGIELYRFAKLYHRPIEFFFTSPTTSASFVYLFRAVNTEQVPHEILIDFHELCRDYMVLEKLVGAPELPSAHHRTGWPSTLDAAEQLARAERATFGLNGQPIRDIADLLLIKAGIRVFHLPADADSFSGAFACDSELGECFLINANHLAGRRSFTIAHEYCHCIAHSDRLKSHIDGARLFDSVSRIEKFANAFASAFLMPESTVNEVLPNIVKGTRGHIGVREIIHLAKYFGVSFQAMGWRLVNLRKITRADWDNILNSAPSLRPLERLLGYPGEEGPAMLPPRYRYLAYKAYEERLISFERLAELLRMNYHELKDSWEREPPGGLTAKDAT